MVWLRPIGYEFVNTVITLRAVKSLGTVIRFNRLNAHAIIEASESMLETPTGKGPLDENFPVGSFLLHKSIRPHVAAFYNLARATDDIADNGALLPEEKLERLDDDNDDGGGDDDDCVVAHENSVRGEGECRH